VNVGIEDALASRVFVSSMKDLGELSNGFAGEIVRPGDADYDEARVVWNGMIDRRPALIVRPTSNDDVAAAVRFARDRDLVVAVRGGGHSIPGLSTCDDGIVIDLSRMRCARVDPEARTARVGGGALLVELDDAAQQHGLVCPVGVVSHTGVGGLALGGGMGRLQRRFGLTIDNLLAVELVTADGRLVRASEDEDSGLLWGMRGAGPNFGIVTAFEFRLHPFAGTVTHGVVIHPVERAEALAERFRELVETGPDTVWASFGVGLALPAEEYPPEVAGGPMAYVAVLHSGLPGDAERDLAALRRLDGAASDSIETKAYLTTQRMSDEASAWGYRFSMRSSFLRSLPDDVVRAWVERVEGVPDGGNGGYSVWSCGGAIAALSDEDTAFTGREGLYWASAEVQWNEPELDDACRTWGRALAEARPYESVGRYVNDVAEVEDGLARSIYGDTKYDRLVALKRKWDPDNVFRLNQNIKP
jgi:FAD/FMN-containing dehydrogenase